MWDVGLEGLNSKTGLLKPWAPDFGLFAAQDAKNILKIAIFEARKRLPR